MFNPLPVCILLGALVTVLRVRPPVFQRNHGGAHLSVGSPHVSYKLLQCALPCDSRLAVAQQSSGQAEPATVCA